MKTNKKGMTEINLTSLVDVCLTLVIIFMVSSPFVLNSGIKVTTPSLKKAQSVKEASDLKAEVKLKTDGGLLLNGSAVPVTQFSDSLRVFLAASASKQVLISAEGEVLHDQVIAIMDEAKQCGAKKLSIVRHR
jgi:biopolymer transport protein ExbD